MFTETLAQSGLGSRLLRLIAGPHGVDRYTELVDPMWTSEDRATVVRVRRSGRNLTVWLQPNHPVAFTAGQYLPVTVEIDGRRHTRCYSPANAEGVGLIELTIVRHPGGVVSEYLHREARPGMTVGLSAPAGDFVLPTPLPRRLLLIARPATRPAGSGTTGRSWARRI
jgi:ferredoxin-NADP reductase